MRFPRLNAGNSKYMLGYLQSTTEHYFYTANVVLSNKISACSLEYTGLERLEHFKRLSEWRGFFAEIRYLVTFESGRTGTACN